MELATAVFPARPSPMSMNLVYGHFCGSLFLIAISIALSVASASAESVFVESVSAESVASLAVSEASVSAAAAFSAPLRPA